MRWFGLCLLLGAVVLVTGCSKKGGDTNSVSGKVTLAGQAVSGTVIFVYADNKEIGTPIGAEGAYSMPNPSTGQVKVLVKGMAGPAAAPTTKGAPLPGVGELPKIPGQLDAGVQPPAKYASAATSDLSYEVKPGKQTYNIELK